MSASELTEYLACPSSFKVHLVKPNRVYYQPACGPNRAAEQPASNQRKRSPPGNSSDEDGVEPGTPAKLIGESQGCATITLTMRIPERLA